jgi:hypothetical protein
MDDGYYKSSSRFPKDETGLSTITNANQRRLEVRGFKLEVNNTVKKRTIRCLEYKGI